MKTAMQELLEEVISERESSINVDFREALDFVKSAIEQDYLDKEKEQMCQFADEFAIECINFHHEKTMSQEKFFDLTFNTNEK
jgi:hypothetical protein